MLRDAKYSSSVFLFLIGVHVDEGSWSGEIIRGGGGGGGACSWVHRGLAAVRVLCHLPDAVLYFQSCGHGA